MFEHFDERARMCVMAAGAEAMRLGHDELGTVHLLLGIARADGGLLGVDVERVRAAVAVLHGSGSPAQGGEMPWSAEAKAALEGANAQALRLGHTTIEPAHVLLALLAAGGGATRALREAGGVPSEVRERANEIAGTGPEAGRLPIAAVPPAPVTARRERSDHGEDLRAGLPVPVVLGVDAAPIGDLGNANVDGRLLELILVAGGPAAQLLRERGIDEQLLQGLPRG